MRFSLMHGNFNGLTSFISLFSDFRRLVHLMHDREGFNTLSRASTQRCGYDTPRPRSSTPCSLFKNSPPTHLCRRMHFESLRLNSNGLRSFNNYLKGIHRAVCLMHRFEVRSFSGLATLLCPLTHPLKPGPPAKPPLTGMSTLHTRVD